MNHEPQPQSPPSGDAEQELETQLIQLEGGGAAAWAKCAAAVLPVCLLLTAWWVRPLVHGSAPAVALAGLALFFALFSLLQHLLVRRLRRKIAYQWQTVVAMHLRSERFEKLAVLDPLTELFTRRYALEQLAKEVARAVRRHETLTVLRLDLEQFRAINERFGRGGGDRALRAFALHLRKAVRSSDVPAYFANDEFLVILPECPVYGVPIALARLRNLSVELGTVTMPLTFSAGCAELQAGDSVTTLLHRAKEALEEDKRSRASQAHAERIAAEVERGEKLQIVGQLTGQVAHDFNNLLAIIKGYSDMMLPMLADNHDAQRKALQITKAADQAAELISQLRVFTSKSSQEWKVINLDERVQDVMALLQPLVGGGVRLSVTTGARSRIRAKPGHLEQILLNLVMNAKDAVAGEGSITVRTRAMAMDDEFVLTHPGSHRGRYLAVGVEDDGCGMEEGLRSRIFDPYFTTKSTGTGLGLATVYGLVKQMGGYIEVQSVPGQGSNFTAYFPLVEERAGDTVTAAGAATEKRPLAPDRRGPQDVPHAQSL